MRRIFCVRSLGSSSSIHALSPNVAERIKRLLARNDVLIRTTTNQTSRKHNDHPQSPNRQLGHGTQWHDAPRRGPFATRSVVPQFRMGIHYRGCHLSDCDKGKETTGRHQEKCRQCLDAKIRGAENSDRIRRQQGKPLAGNAVAARRCGKSKGIPRRGAEPAEKGKHHAEDKSSYSSSPQPFPPC